MCVRAASCLRLCVSHGRRAGLRCFPPASGCLVFHSSAQTEELPRPRSQRTRTHTPGRVFQRWLDSPAARDDGAGQFQACNVVPLSPARSAGYAISAALFILFFLAPLAATAVRRDGAESPPVVSRVVVLFCLLAVVQGGLKPEIYVL